MLEVDLPAGSIEKFIARWSASSAHERAHKDMFFTELCDALGVERPDPKDKSGDYCFERAVSIDLPDGRTSTGFIDFYRRGSFVCEAKQGSEAGDQTLGTARRGTALWDKAMRAAYGQALRYAAYLPEGKPPFLMTADIGNCFEIWSGFGGHYGGYGARRTIELAQLADPAVSDFLVKVFADPLDLDPARHAQRVTREVAAKLADLARDLEKSGHDPELTAQFLMRCLFTMFSEDVGLLPEKLFTRAVAERWLPEPRRFPAEVEQLWKAMNDGLPFGFDAKLLRFNGGLFARTQSLPMTAEQLQLLLDAAKCDWSNVEPTIFGALLERALDPFERQKLGAHFTPRQYIERLVRPAVIEPLRAEWEIAQAEARQALTPGPSPTEGARGEDPALWEPTPAQKKKAAAAITAFHDKLVHTRVLDPACGSGNFLYVCLDLFKQIEAEVMRELADLGVTQAALELQGVMVNPGQFLGIELNPRAREIADLVLWIGYLQWYRRTHVAQAPPPGDGRPQPGAAVPHMSIPEPVLREYKNIVCRDAVLAYDDIRPRVGENGKPITTWDQRTYKTHPVTGKQVPDEDARVPIYDYVNARPAEWPEADYVVSNPPFGGARHVSATLGDGYLSAIRRSYDWLPDNADFVMYWWDKAASLAREKRVKCFGFITTNSITQSFSRKIVDRHLGAKTPLYIVYALPDHAWVDSYDGADVRIAMTVGSGIETSGQLLTSSGTGFYAERRGRINADLTIGTHVDLAVSLLSNSDICSVGYQLSGQGFVLARDEADGLDSPGAVALDEVLFPLLTAHDIAQGPRKALAIDLFGLSIPALRERYPRVYQWVLDRVKPERDSNRRRALREQWWLYGEKRPGFRKAKQGLERILVTPLTAKHRYFVAVDSRTIADSTTVMFAMEDSYFLGVLSSAIHVHYSLRAGGKLGVGNDPRYLKAKCFDTFPFPDATDDQKARIRDLGERLDAHRKRVQAEHPDVTLTGMYNALERLRALTPASPTLSRAAVEGESRAPLARSTGEGSGVSVMALSATERAFHEKALIGILKQIHDELDAAVAEAYGWPVDLPDEEILARLVALNHERAAEEKRGLVRWLRPEFQNPTGKSAAPVEPQLEGLTVPDKAASPVEPQPWPKATPEQLKAIRDLLASRPGSWSADDVANAFKGARKAAVQRHLETLELLGVLAAVADDAGRRWSSLAR